MKSKKQPGEKKVALSSAQIGIKCLVLIVYFDGLMLLSLVTNTRIFRSGTPKDIAAAAAVVILALFKSYVLVRMSTTTIKTREWVSVACLLLSMIIHQELNVQFGIGEDDAISQPTGRFYRENHQVLLGTTYLAMNHWAHPKRHLWVDPLVVIYFSFRKNYSMVDLDVVGGFMCLVVLGLWKLILDGAILERGGFFGPSPTQKGNLAHGSDKVNNSELDILSNRNNWPSDREGLIASHDPELNHNGYQMLAYRNQDASKGPDPQIVTDRRPEPDQKAIELTTLSPSAKHLSAESYPIEFDCCLVFDPISKKIIKEYTRTQERELLDALFHLKSQLESGKKIAIIQKNIQSISDLQGEEEAQPGMTSSSVFSGHKGDFGSSADYHNFKFDGFDPLLNRLLIKSLHTEYSDLLKHLSRLCSPKPNLSSQNLPFQEFISLHRQEVQKSKTHAGTGSYNRLTSLVERPPKTHPVTFHDQPTSALAVNFVKKNITKIPENMTVQVNCQVCLRVPHLPSEQPLVSSKSSLQTVPVVFNSTIVPYFKFEQLPNGQSHLKDVQLRIYLKQFEVKTDKSVTLLNHLSHEVRSPLIATLGLMKMFIQHARDLPGFKTEPNFEKLIENYLTQGILQINNLLDACQLILELTKNSKDAKIKPTEFNLKKLVFETAKLFTFLNSRRDKVQLVVDCPFDDEDEYVKSDPIRIRQILVNLISNALKYTLEGEVRVLVCRNTFKDICISVIDTGIGIKEENLNKLFKEFGRIHSKEDEQLNGQGVGLGLNLSNQLAYSVSCPTMKTGIDVKSEYHKGSSFSFQIFNYFEHEIEVETFLTKYISPEVLQRKMIEETGTDRSHTQAQTRKLLGKMQTMRRAENVQVMLVDDSEHNLEFVEILFANLNIKVESYSNPQQALKRVEERIEQACPKCAVFDMILVDYEMPFMTGAELALAIRLLPGYRHIPIICFSAQEILLGNDINKGITTCMLKPISAEDIQGLVEKYISPKSPHVCTGSPKFVFETREPEHDPRAGDAEQDSGLMLQSTGEDRLAGRPDAYQTTCFQTKPQNMFRTDRSLDSSGHKKSRILQGSGSSSKPTG